MKVNELATTRRGTTTTTRIFYTPSHFSAKITEAPCSLLAHSLFTPNSLRGHIWHDLDSAYTYLCTTPRSCHIQPLRKRSFYQDVIKHVRCRSYASLDNQSDNQSVRQSVRQPISQEYTYVNSYSNLLL